MHRKIRRLRRKFREFKHNASAHVRSAKVIAIIVAIAVPYIIIAALAGHSNSLVTTVEAAEGRVASMGEELNAVTVQLDDQILITSEKEAEIEELRDQIAEMGDDMGSTSLEYAVSRDEMDLLCRTIQAEAGPRNYQSQKITLHVILNRVASDKFPNTIKEVIYQPGQFEVVPRGMINTPPTDEVIANIKDELLYNEVEVPKGVMYFHSSRIDDRVSRSVWDRCEGTTFTY